MRDDQDCCVAVLIGVRNDFYEKKSQGEVSVQVETKELKKFRNAFAMSSFGGNGGSTYRSVSQELSDFLLSGQSGY